jgi:ribosome-associated protein
MASTPQTAQRRYHTDRTILEREVVVEPFRSGGPGGQHRNVTDSAVRLRHVPSSIQVTAADSRSQHRNRETAFARLITRLKLLNRVPKPRIPTRVSAQAAERRLRGKKQRTAIKRTRARIPDDES